jgi:predicted deacetylase
VGLKAKKVRLGAIRRDIVRRESRWVRRLLRQHRRFARWIRDHNLNWQAAHTAYEEPLKSGKGTVNRKNLYNAVTGRFRKDTPQRG